MRKRFLLLDRGIQKVLATIDDLYGELGEPSLGKAEPQETLIVVAYRLHGLYNAFENIFLSIAKTFENSLDAKADWRAQLLGRMRLDLSPLRPAVIDDDAYEKLDELRRFRHLFRTSYGTPLDAARLSLVLDKALKLKPVIRPQIERFLDALGAGGEEPSGAGDEG